MAEIETETELIDDATAGAGRRRLSPEARREALFDAALAVFLESGFGRASLAEIAERAGVTKGCVYHHFASKEELLLGLMQARLCGQARPDGEFGQLCRKLGEDSSLDTAISQIWNFYQVPEQLAMATLALTELPKAPDVARAFFEEGCEPAKDPLVPAIQRALPEGTTLPSETADALADLIPAMILGAALMQRLRQTMSPDTALSDERVAELIPKLLLHGISLAPHQKS